MSEPAQPGISAATAPGLSSAEARALLLRWGPNAVPETRRHPLRALLAKFWAPVPWMLEVTAILELALHKSLEALLITLLLVFNAGLSFFEEGRARNALALLRKRLANQARVLRDGVWRLLPAAELVPGDFVHLQMGDIAPADLELREGAVLLDQSALTGESMPLEAGAGAVAYAGALVKRGAASGVVTATGPRTYFGRTAELVRSAMTVSHLQRIIFAIIRYLIAMDSILAVAVFVFALGTALPLFDTIPFVLILLVASVPVALPATFTVATVLGAVELAGQGVLVTRLSAVEEAAAMDVLCSDKTGTLTQNSLSLEVVQPYPPFDRQELLNFAAYASDEAAEDPLDRAVLAVAGRPAPARRLKFTPFEPATKLAEALIVSDGAEVLALKGAPRAIAERLGRPAAFDAAVEGLAAGGFRVLAVAAGPPEALRAAGLLAFRDPPRPESSAVVARLRALGVRTLMITGDGLETARAVAAQVGITGPACTADDLHAHPERALDCQVFAGVFPEDKFRLVQGLQQRGHIVGMTGDGVNDAPALKQAEVGIAVANATDVAKAAASLVLVEPGLASALAAVETSRRIYQRMLTYTLNKIIKTVEIALFLSLGVLALKTFVITPRLIVMLLFTNDFVTMAIATDRVAASPHPDRWEIRRLMGVGISLGGLVLLLSFSLFFFGRNYLRLPLPQLQTMVFLTLVFSGQGMVYLVRERRRLFSSRPSLWLMLSSVLDIALVAMLAIHGVLMAPLPAAVVGEVLLACALYLFALDFVKAPLFARLMGSQAERASQGARPALWSRGTMRSG